MESFHLVLLHLELSKTVYEKSQKKVICYIFGMPCHNLRKSFNQDSFFWTLQWAKNFVVIA